MNEDIDGDVVLITQTPRGVTEVVKMRDVDGYVVRGVALTREALVGLALPIVEDMANDEEREQVGCW